MLPRLQVSDPSLAPPPRSARPPNAYNQAVAAEMRRHVAAGLDHKSAFVLAARSWRQGANLQAVADAQRLWQEETAAVAAAAAAAAVEAPQQQLGGLWPQPDSLSPAPASGPAGLRSFPDVVHGAHGAALF